MKRKESMYFTAVVQIRPLAVLCFCVCLVAGSMPTSAYSDEYRIVNDKSLHFNALEADAIDEDVKTLDGIIKAYYEVVSGPAGSIPDKARDLKIHISGAQVIMMSGDAENAKPNIMTVAQYHERNSKPRKTGFFEYEIKRETRQYGSMTHIWSTYEWKTEQDGPVGGRGINSIHLFNDGKRWWIAAEIYDVRNKPVPEEYMP